MGRNKLDNPRIETAKIRCKIEHKDIIVRAMYELRERLEKEGK